MPVSMLRATLRPLVFKAFALRASATPSFAWRLALLAVVLLGCGSREAHDTASSGKNTPIPACEAYVAAMRHCMGAASPKALAAGEASFAAMKASFTAETDQDRAAIGEQCAARLKLVTGACR